MLPAVDPATAPLIPPPMPKLSPTDTPAPAAFLMTSSTVPPDKAVVAADKAAEPTAALTCAALIPTAAPTLAAELPRIADPIAVPIPGITIGAIARMVYPMVSIQDVCGLLYSAAIASALAT